MATSTSSEKPQGKPLSPFQQKMFRLMMRPMTWLNVVLYKMSGGKIFGTLGGSPVVLVTMTGAKTGKIRTIPLIHIPRGDDVILIASQGGMPKHPAWYHNLMAHPDVEIQVGAEKRKMHVRQASDAEKAEVWPLAVSIYKDFDLYQSRTDRNIPVLILSPR